MSSSKKKAQPGDGSSKKGAKRPLKQRDTDAAVDRIIKTNFSGWSSSATDVVQKDGKNLRDTLAEERRRCAADGGRVSSKFIADQKTRFRSEESDDVMKVPDDCPPCRPELLVATAKAISTNPYARNKGPMLALLQTDMRLNDREAIGLIRAVSGLSPHTSQESRSFIMAVLSFFYRTEQAAQYKPQLLTQRSLWDAALLATLAFHRKHGLGARSFVDMYGGLFDVLSPALPGDALAIVRARGDHKAVRVEVLRAHSSSALGESLFADAKAEVAVEDFASICRTKFDILEKEGAGKDLIKSAQAHLEIMLPLIELIFEKKKGLLLGGLTFLCCSSVLSSWPCLKMSSSLALLQNLVPGSTLCRSRVHLGQSCTALRKAQSGACFLSHPFGHGDL